MITIHLFMLFCILSISDGTNTSSTLNGPESHGLRDKTSTGTISTSNIVITRPSKIDSTYTSPTPATLTAVTVPPYSSECHATVTDFAYQNNFCAGAQDPESYLHLARPRYRCLGRCGQAPKYGKIFSECGCDATCTVYKDCCRDVFDVCPELLNTQIDEKLYAVVAKEFRVCRDYVKIHGDGLQSLPSKPQELPSTGYKEHALPYKPRNLVELGLPFFTYKVIEKNSKLIFYNYATYRSHNITNSTLYFIPKVISLTCFYNSTKTGDSHSIFPVLPWCRVKNKKDLKTHYHRPCKKNQILTCRCEDGNLLKDHVHNACLGRKYHTSIFRYKLWDRHVELLPNFNLKKEKCLLYELSSGRSNLLNYSNNGPSIPYINSEQNYNIKLRISPVASHFKIPQSTINDGAENDEIRIQEELYFNQGSKLHFIVELSSTVERRFYCASLLSRFQDCWLMDCAEGGILWTGHLSNGQSARRTCVVPVGVRVLHRDGSSRVPFCTCLNVVAALNGLKIWKITFDPSETTKCSLLLETISTGKFCCHFPFARD